MVLPLTLNAEDLSEIQTSPVVESSLYCLISELFDSTVNVRIPNVWFDEPNEKAFGYRTFGFLTFGSFVVLS